MQYASQDDDDHVRVDVQCITSQEFFKGAEVVFVIRRGPPRHCILFHHGTLEKEKEQSL